MYAFEFHKPSSLEEASRMLASVEEPKLLAGGQTLIPTMKQRLASPSNVIHLGAVPELRGIAREGDDLVIGAMTTYAEIVDSEIVRSAIPGLADMTKIVGDPHVRHMGTCGGSVANNDPSSDYPAACLALKATIVTNKRRVAADDFFVAMFETALEPDEIIVKISFPIPDKASYAKFRNPASRYALVGVFVARGKDGDVRVAVTGAGPQVFRIPAMEEALKKDFSAKALEGIAVPAEGLNDDIHASAPYRAHLIGVMARRAVS